MNILDTKVVRLLIDEPQSGTINMARDEVLLRDITVAHRPPVLRFYSWRPPTISLGYFQDFADYGGLEPPAGDLAVVRRSTGGGAILHDLEVTYSLTLPIDDPLVKGRPNRLYEIAHQAIIAAIGHGARLLGADQAGCGGSSQRGPFFCFAHRHGLDVVIDDPQSPTGVSKIAGSAQRRSQHAILQHGSIMLASRYPQQPVATWSGLEESIDFSAAVRRLAPAFQTALGRSMEQGEWLASELEAVERVAMKYAGDGWTRDRQR